MEQRAFHQKIKKAEQRAYWGVFFTAFAGVLLLIFIYVPTFSFFEKDTVAYKNISEDEDKIENGIHIRTGLIDADGLMTVVNNCTNCHSSKLITQNRMTAERWNATIAWMQKTQNLWDLGSNQAIIVNYLVTNYPIEEKGRRENLKNINWYTFKTKS